ncbi:type III effector protein, putative [Babesia ovata]|uniref:Type III effector protein, putative n=1 Tax=Babesia ovata TaxID=189622 RepID=A0A2H6K8F4_9APIC|nr:type III effector protein, putative [Babesia ovata]GBE59271.1 type III effector protein, putative [Babesia ovata]
MDSTPSATETDTSQTWTDMQQLLAALRAAKPAHLPRLGLRLVNALAGPRPPAPFWLEYVRRSLEPPVFSAMSPHSKCLLTCVACRLGKEAARAAQADKLVERVFRDVTSTKALHLLNLELINMVLVASYTLGLPLSQQQMQRILDQTSQLVERDAHFNVELTVSILHSLGAIARVYPRQRDQLASSQVVQRVLSGFRDFEPRLNMRELSLVLYAFDKLRVIDKAIAEVLIARVEKERSTLSGQTQATILFACAAHPALHRVLGILRENVVTGARSFTGREACNVYCAYLKAGLWDDQLSGLLEYSLPKMNAQELCNVVNLMIQKEAPVRKSFTSAYARHLNTALVTMRLSLLDALTLTQSIAHWGLADRMRSQVLDDAISKTLAADRSAYSAKHVYLLHYLVTLDCRGAARRAVDCAAQRFDPKALSNKEIVVLYNALWHFGSGSSCVGLVELELKRRLDQQQTFSAVDLQTLAHWGDSEICGIIADKYLSENECSNEGHIKLLNTLLRKTDSDSARALARRAVEAMLKPGDANRANIAGNADTNIDGDADSVGRMTSNTPPKGGCNVDMPLTVRHQAAACQLLPHLQGELNVVPIFCGLVEHWLQIRDGGEKIEMRWLIACLSVARKLNVRSASVASLANGVVEHLDGGIDPQDFLDYINAVYHLDIVVDNIGALLDVAVKVLEKPQDEGVKESILFTLSAMQFSGHLTTNSISDSVMSRCLALKKPPRLCLKTLYMCLVHEGYPTSHIIAQAPTFIRSLQLRTNNVDFDGRTHAESHIGYTPVHHRRSTPTCNEDNRNEVHFSVYSTLQKIYGNKPGLFLRAEAPAAFDYVADILLITSSRRF